MVEGVGQAVANGLIALVVIAFLAGALFVGGIVWVWPYLPSVSI